MNLAIIEGTVLSARVREHPSTTKLLNLEVQADGVSVPVVVHDPVQRIVEGDHVHVRGTIRRRFFRAGGVTQSRVEIEAHTVRRFL